MFLRIRHFLYHQIQEIGTRCECGYEEARIVTEIVLYVILIIRSFNIAIYLHYPWFELEGIEYLLRLVPKAYASQNYLFLYLLCAFILVVFVYITCAFQYIPRDSLVYQIFTDLVVKNWDYYHRSLNREKCTEMIKRKSKMLTTWESWWICPRALLRAISRLYAQFLVWKNNDAIDKREMARMSLLFFPNLSVEFRCRMVQMQHVLNFYLLTIFANYSKFELGSFHL